MNSTELQANLAARMRLTVLLCFLAAMCEGIDLQAAGVAAAGIRQQFHPDSQWLAYFFSASTLGLFFGAMLGGRLADRIGRKRVLVFSIVVFGLFSLLTPLSWDFQTLIVVRLLTGLGLGGALPNLLSIGSESAPAHRRSVSVTMIYAGTPLGGAIASLVSLLTSAADWPWIFYLGGIVPLFVACAIGRWLQESTAFTQLATGVRLRDSRLTRLSSIFEEGRAWRTLLLWVSFALALLTLYLLLNWLPTLLSGSGLARPEVALAMIGFNLGGCLSALLIGFHLETRLRHRGVLATFIGLPLLVLLLAVVPGRATPVVLTVCALGVAVVAAQAILYAFAPLCYPTRIRGTGVGFAVAMGRIGSILGPLFGGLLVGAGRSPAQVLTGLLPLTVLGSLCAIVLAWRQPPAQHDHSPASKSRPA